MLHVILFFFFCFFFFFFFFCLFLFVGSLSLKSFIEKWICNKWIHNKPTGTKLDYEEDYSTPELVAEGVTSEWRPVYGPERPQPNWQGFY